jgi:anaerobic magnesium-protoporphyrin IX monomethyl ester cyclase
VKKDMEKKTNWTDSNDLDLLFKSNFSPGYYKILHRYIHKYFRFKQSLFYFRLAARRFKTNRHQARRILLMPYYLVFAFIYRILLRKL